MVKSGDSLWKIAKEQLGDETKVEELAAFNNLSVSGILMPGKELKLPYSLYIIKTGDTLWRIGGNSIIGAQKIADFNHMNVKDTLTIGKTLRIPFEVASPKTIVEGNAGYVVKQGDCLRAIAKKELGSESRFLEIATLNNIKALDSLSVGQVLIIPSSQEKLLATQDEGVRQETKQLITDLIPNRLNEESPLLEERIKKSMEIYINLLIKISWLEGPYRHMYLDGEGLVTIGLGFNVNDRDLLKRCFNNNVLTFYQNDEVVLAFETVEKAYAYVKKQRPGLKGQDYYKTGENDLLIPELQMISVSELHLKNYVIPQIQKEFPNLDKIYKDQPPPIAAIVGMIDKVYNAGMGRLKMPAKKGGFPKFVAAFRESDFVTCAKESGNKPKEGMGGILKRNTFDYELFMEASRY